MVINRNVYQKRLELFNLAGELQNVSKACKMMGVSRQYYYELRKVYQLQGEEGLKEKNRKKPNLKNRVAPEIEKAVVSYAFQYPAFGQVRAANELRQKGIEVSPGGVRSIWKRNGMQNYRERVCRLKEIFMTGAAV